MHKNETEHDEYLRYHLSLLRYILAKRITICSKSFTYFQNFILCFFPREEDSKYVFLNL